MPHCGKPRVLRRAISRAIFDLDRAAYADIVIAAKLDRPFRSALDALKVVESLKTRGVKLHLLDLGGDIAGNGISKLFLTIAAAFADAERDRIRERIGQVKADQKARGRYLGGNVPFGFLLQDDGGGLIPHEAEQDAIREMIALRPQGRPLRAIAAAVAAKGFRISHEGVAGMLRAAGIAADRVGSLSCGSRPGRSNPSRSARIGRKPKSPRVPDPRASNKIVKAGRSKARL